MFGIIVKFGKTKIMMLDPESTKAALDAAKPFLEQIANPPLQEMGYLFQDRVRLWRFNQQLSFIGKAKKKAEKYKVPLKAISLKILTPMLEGASLEEDPDLQDMWANLLVNYADSRQQLESAVFPYILGQLSSKEARVLKFNRGESKHHFYNRSDWEGKGKLSNLETINLIRLGILQEKYSYFPPNEGSGKHRPSHLNSLNSDVQMTSLANEFLKACMLSKEDVIKKD